VDYIECRGQRKREKQIDLELAIKEGSSMGGLYPAIIIGKCNGIELAIKEGSSMGGLYLAIIFGKFNGWVWLPAKCLLHTHLHRWRKREKKKRWGKEGNVIEHSPFNRLLDR